MLNDHRKKNNHYVGNSNTSKNGYFPRRGVRGSIGLEEIKLFEIEEELQEVQQVKQEYNSNDNDVRTGDSVATDSSSFSNDENNRSTRFLRSTSGENPHNQLSLCYQQQMQLKYQRVVNDQVPLSVQSDNPNYDPRNYYDVNFGQEEGEEKDFGEDADKFVDEFIEEYTDDFGDDGSVKYSYTYNSSNKNIQYSFSYPPNRDRLQSRDIGIRHSANGSPTENDNSQRDNNQPKKKAHSRRIDERSLKCEYQFLHMRSKDEKCINCRHSTYTSSPLKKELTLKELSSARISTPASFFGSKPHPLDFSKFHERSLSNLHIVPSTNLSDISPLNKEGKSTLSFYDMLEEKYKISSYMRNRFTAVSNDANSKTGDEDILPGGNHDETHTEGHSNGK